MEQVNNVAKCPFCQCEFKIDKEDIKVEKIPSYDRGYFTLYKVIKCPVCDEYIARICLGTTPNRY